MTVPIDDGGTNTGNKNKKQAGIPKPAPDEQPTTNKFDIRVSWKLPRTKTGVATVNVLKLHLTLFNQMTKADPTTSYITKAGKVIKAENFPTTQQQYQESFHNPIMEPTGGGKHRLVLCHTVTSSLSFKEWKDSFCPFLKQNGIFVFPNTTPEYRGAKVTLGWLFQVHPNLTHRSTLLGKINKHLGLTTSTDANNPLPTIEISKRKVYSGKEHIADALHIIVPMADAKEINKRFMTTYNHHDDLPGEFIATSALNKETLQTKICLHNEFVKNTYGIPVSNLHPESLPDPCSLPEDGADQDGMEVTKSFKEWILGHDDIFGIEPTTMSADKGKHFILTTSKGKHKAWQHIDNIFSQVYSQDSIPVGHRFEDTIPHRNDTDRVPLCRQTEDFDSYVKSITANLPNENDNPGARRINPWFQAKTVKCVYAADQANFPDLPQTKRQRKSTRKTGKKEQPTPTDDADDDPITKLTQEVAALTAMLVRIAKHVGFDLSDDPQATQPEAQVPPDNSTATLQDEAPMETDEETNSKRKRDDDENAEAGKNTKEPAADKVKTLTNTVKSLQYNIQAMDKHTINLQIEKKKVEEENQQLKKHLEKLIRNNGARNENNAPSTATK